MADAIQRYHGTTRPMDRFTGILIPEGADPGAVIMSDPILSSPIVAVPLMRASFKAPGGFADVTDKYMVRQADDHPLGVVGDRYRALQPKDIAAMLSTLHANFGLQFQTAMLLEDGATFLTQANLRTIDLGPLQSRRGAKRDTGGRDIVQGFLTIADNYTGKRTATAGCSSTRAVCENTAAHAMSDSAKSLFGRPIRHTGDVAGKLAQWEHAIEDAIKALGRFETFARAAVSTPITRDTAAGIVETLIPLPEGARPGKAQAKRDAIMGAFDSGMGNSGRSVWDLYNGVTEFANWSAPVKGADADAARLESLLWNGLGDLVQEAENHLRVYLSL